MFPRSCVGTSCKTLCVLVMQVYSGRCSYGEFSGERDVYLAWNTRYGFPRRPWEPGGVKFSDSLSRSFFHIVPTFLRGNTQQNALSFSDIDCLGRYSYGGFPGGRDVYLAWNTRYGPGRFSGPTTYHKPKSRPSLSICVKNTDIF